LKVDFGYLLNFSLQNHLLSHIVARIHGRNLNAQLSFRQRPFKEEKHEILFSILLSKEPKEQICFNRILSMIFDWSDEIHCNLIDFTLILILVTDISSWSFLQILNRSSFGSATYAFPVEFIAVNFFNQPHEFFNV